MSYHVISYSQYINVTSPKEPGLFSSLLFGSSKRLIETATVMDSEGQKQSSGPVGKVMSAHRKRRFSCMLPSQVASHPGIKGNFHD